MTSRSSSTPIRDSKDINFMLAKENMDNQKQKLKKKLGYQAYIIISSYFKFFFTYFFCPSVYNFNKLDNQQVFSLQVTYSFGFLFFGSILDNVINPRKLLIGV